MYAFDRLLVPLASGRFRGATLKLRISGFGREAPDPVPDTGRSSQVSQGQLLKFVHAPRDFKLGYEMGYAARELDSNACRVNVL